MKYTICLIYYKKWIIPSIPKVIWLALVSTVIEVVCKTIFNFKLTFRVNCVKFCVFWKNFSSLFQCMFGSSWPWSLRKWTFQNVIFKRDIENFFQEVTWMFPEKKCSLSISLPALAHFGQNIWWLYKPHLLRHFKR